MITESCPVFEWVIRGIGGVVNMLIHMTADQQFMTDTQLSRLESMSSQLQDVIDAQKLTPRRR